MSVCAACSAKSDVVFVLDSSDAVGQANYQKELDFVRQTVSRWDVGPNGVQVSATVDIVCPSVPCVLVVSSTLTSTFLVSSFLVCLLSVLVYYLLSKSLPPHPFP